MNIGWKSKAVIQCILSRIPYGHLIHRKLQDIAGTSRPDIKKHYEGRLQFVHQMKEYGIKIDNAVFLDIGTGWHPIIPLLFYLLGAKKVTTIDIKPWLSRKSLAETISLLDGVLVNVATDFGKVFEDLKVRLDFLRKLNEDNLLSVRDVLHRANIQYICPMDVTKTTFADKEYDCILSFSVLQCIHRHVIADILSESHRILKGFGWNIHHIYTGDPFAYDRRITTINFLKFSEPVWYWIGGSGLAYHNRLRCVDYLKIFSEKKYEVKYKKTNIDPEALKALEVDKIKISSKFHGYSYEELACSGINIFSQKA